MDLIELTDECLDELLVEDDVADALPLGSHDGLWLQQKVALLAHLVLQVLAHQVREVGAYAELSVPWDSSQRVIFYYHVLLDGLGSVLLRVRVLVARLLGVLLHQAVLLLLVEQLSKLLKNHYCWDLDLRHAVLLVLLNIP